jgi:ribosomal protein S14
MKHKKKEHACKEEKCRICGSHSGGFGEFYLLEYNAL